MADIAIASLANGGVLYQRPDGSTYTYYPKASGYSTPTTLYEQGTTRDDTTQPTTSNQPGNYVAPELDLSNPVKKTNYANSMGYDTWDQYQDAVNRGDAPGSSKPKTTFNYTPVNYSLPKTSTPSYSTPTFNTPTFTDSLSSFGNTLSQFGKDYFTPHAGSTKIGGVALPDFGYSELLQGIKNTIIPTAYASSGGSDLFDNGSVLGVSDYGNDQPKQSFAIADKSFTPGGVPVASSRSGGTLDKYGNQLNIKAQDIFGKAKAAQDSFTPESYTMPDYNQAVENVNDMYALLGGQEMEESDAMALYDKQKEDAINALMEQYNISEEQALGMIPKYEKFRDEAVGRLDRDLGEFKEDASERKVDTENRYGELIRKSSGNKRYLDAQRRNQFSALGTAESSAFIDQQTMADRDFLREQTNTERELAQAVNNIDQAVKAQETKVIDMKNDLETQAQNEIDEIMDNIRLSDAEKRAAINNVINQVETAKQGLIKEWNDQKAAMIQYQYELAGQKGLLAQEGNIQDSLLRTQYALESQANQLRSQMPTELEAALQQFSSAPYSGGSAVSLAKNLKSKYPEWGDLIDGVFSGQQQYTPGMTAPSSGGYSQYLAQ